MVYTNEPLVMFRVHAASKSVARQERFIEEHRRVYDDLSRDVRMGTLRSLAKRRHRSQELMNIIDSQITGESEKLKKIAQLLLIFMEKPYVITSRFYWGAFRRLLR